MLLLRLLFKAIRVLGSETSASSLAAAFALGLFTGLVPWISLQAALVLACVLLLRVNLTAWLVSTLLGKLLAAALVGPLDALGARLLEDEGLRSLWTSLTHDPVLGFLSVGDSVALGGTLVGLASLVPAFLLGRLAVRAYRSHVEGRLAASPLGRALGGLRVVSLYQKLTRPFA